MVVENGDDRFEVHSEALAMITFISNRLIVGVSPALREFAGLSVNEARTMLFINAGAVTTAAEATRFIGIDQAAVSRSVQRLVKAGFVLSKPDAQHAKRNLLTLTEKGDAYARAIWRFNRKREDRLLSVLGPAERAFFLDILSRVLANVEAANAVEPRLEWLEDASE
jgi:DNA-binding MarR family transcriptional regulator